MNDSWVLFADANTPNMALANAFAQMAEDGYQPKGKQKYYRITVEDITTPQEKPRWWYWDMEQGWVFSFEPKPRIEIEKGRIKSVVVYGTSETRGKKVDDMFDAMMEAGKP